MTALIVLLLLAAPAPLSLEQVRAEANLERRAKVAIDYAQAAERNAETAYTKGDVATVTAELKNMQTAVELAQDAFEQTGKTPQRHPGPYKSAELRTQEILVRLGDLEKRMDSDERQIVGVPRTKVQEIHDVWFDGLMSRKK